MNDVDVIKNVLGTSFGPLAPEPSAETSLKKQHGQMYTRDPTLDVEPDGELALVEGEEHRPHRKQRPAVVEQLTGRRDGG